ncbi:MAG: Shikimate dehydrogenase [Pseudomonadota bacterium]|jgi:shikimate dehydrogenase
MTDRYAVIGHPISHTQSPQIHALFAAATGQDMAYTAIEGRLGAFADDVAAFRRTGGLGMNVTVPFKLDALACATECSDRAHLSGAANALKFEGDKILADNFDGVGLTRDVTHNLRFPLAGQRVLILGAGGATRGMVLPFLAQHPQCLVITDLTLDPAQAVANEVAAHGVTDCSVTACTYDTLAGQFDRVFNATSASLFGQLPPITANVFAPGCLAYELVYGKGLTPFLALAQQSGAGTLADGVGMLVEQAAEAFEWWRGVRPATAQVIQQLKVPLF